MSDAELVARLKAREDDAYREVLARYGSALYRYVFAMTGDSQLSEDIVGETYLRMVEKIDTYTFSGVPFKSWLYRIAHNLTLNAVERARRVVGVDDLEQVARPVTDPALRIVDRLEAEVVREALGHLTEEQRQVVLLRFVGEHSPDEIAQMMDKNENAIKQMQFRALRSLGRWLERRS